MHQVKYYKVVRWFSKKTLYSHVFQIFKAGAWFDDGAQSDYVQKTYLCP